MLILLGRTRKGIGNSFNIPVLSSVFGVGQTKLYRKGSACKSVVNIAYTADELLNGRNDVKVGKLGANACEKCDLLVGLRHDGAVVEADPSEATVVTAKEYLVFTKISVKRNYEVANPRSIGICRCFLLGLKALEDIGSLKLRIQTLYGGPITVAAPRKIYIFKICSSYKLCLGKILGCLVLGNYVLGVCIIYHGEGAEGRGRESYVTFYGVIGARDLLIVVIKLKGLGVEALSNVKVYVNVFRVTLLNVGNGNVKCLCLVAVGNSNVGADSGLGYG